MTSIPLSRKTTRRLSVPVRDTRPPREIDDAELATLLRIADCLIPAAGPNPAASEAENYLKYLHLALAARAPNLQHRLEIECPALHVGLGQMAARCICRIARAEREMTFRRE